MSDIEELVRRSVEEALGDASSAIADELRRRADEAARAARSRIAEDLAEALAEIDAATTQAEVLSALLREGGRFASRTALLLTFSSGSRGWATYGFADAVQPAGDLEIDEGGPWTRFVDRAGLVSLTGEECEFLCDPLGATLPEEGVLIPLMLRGRLAAAVYADRIDDDELSIAALQVLTYGTAFRLELLSLGLVGPTATLRDASEEAPAPALWDPEAVAADAPPAPVTAPREPEMASPPEEAEDVEAVETSETPWAVEEVEGKEEVVEPAEVWEEPETVEDEEAVLEAEVEEIPEEPGEAIGVEEEGAEPPYSEATVRISRETMEELTTAPPPEPADVATTELAEPPPEEVEVEESEAEEIEAEEIEAEAVEVEELPAEEVSDVEALPEVEPEPAEEPTPPPEPPPAGELEAGEAPRPETEGTEVAPPPDLEGPGWAFRDQEGSDTAAIEDPEQAALHEEARRLARLLVSEIKLYNEEQVEDGRQHGDIYSRLQEDIDRSRQMYSERVDPSVRDEADYFYQEMVNILAGGDEDALGM